MANTVEYILSLKDQVSGKLTRIGIANDQQLATWAKVQIQVNAANNTMVKCGVSIGSLKQRIDTLRAEREWIPASNINAIRRTNIEVKRLEKQMRRLESVNGGKIKILLNDAFNSIPFAPLLQNPLILAGAVIAKSIQTGFEREQTDIAFNVLLGGNQNAAQKMLGEIRKFGEITPYQTADLHDNAKMMLSFGIAQDKIMPNLRMLGDIAMGNKDKMNSLTLAFSQMNAAGRLMGQDLLQMVNAGFNPLKEISRKTGKSLGALREEMEKGCISADMVNTAFQSATEKGGLFYGMTDKMGKSGAGLWSTVMGKVSDSFAKAYKIIEPIVKVVLSLIMEALDIISGALDWVMKGIGKVSNFLREHKGVVLGVAFVLGTLATAMYLMTLKAKLSALWTGIMTFKTWGWAAAQNALNLSLLANPVTWIVAGVIALIAVIVLLCVKVKGWATLWDGVIIFAKYTFFAYVDSVKLYFSTLVNGIMMGLDKIKLGWYKFKEACGLGDSSENRAAIAKINADVEARQKAISDGAKKVTEDLQKAKSGLSGIKLEIDDTHTLKSVTAGLKKKLGFGANDQLIAGTEGDGGGGKHGGSNTGNNISNVTAGGTRNTQITINLGKMIENIVFNGGYSENKQGMISEIEEAVARILYMAQTSA